MTSQPPPRPAARSYDGEGIVVGFDAHRCLHAAECVRGLPTVFDVGRRPWIQPDNAPADEVADVIHRCPRSCPQSLVWPATPGTHSRGVAEMPE
ncbi:(4Fe-4S)-binding protein [Streptomyces sp. DH18]|uniref:(4Fe-4S)-binding protein n=1 Tax=Streptomyces sp. DH18 TaxID=3040126 RepID=UPI002442C731|nr:(4Fe-4S)-binding protein [Streptomyces sp. DH18]MDG9683854.1 (4Fe-4S)-binding protein [Streptomyces sp. DH18]